MVPPNDRTPKETLSLPKRPRAGNSKRSKTGDSTAAEDTDDPGRGWEARELRPDPTASTAVVVIHPGSTNLRIGLFDAESPVVIPHCIAFRRNKAARGKSVPLDPTDALLCDAVAVCLEPALVPLARQVTSQMISNHPAASRPNAQHICGCPFSDWQLQLATLLIGEEHSLSLPSVAPSAAGVESPARASACAAPAPAPAPTTEDTAAPFLVGQAALSAAAAEPDNWVVVHPWRYAGINHAASSS